MRIIRLNLDQRTFQNETLIYISLYKQIEVNQNLTNLSL